MQALAPGAKVTVTNGSDTYEATTNSWGDFWIDGLADDEWDATIAKDGKEMKLSVSTVAEDRGLGDVAFV